MDITLRRVIRPNLEDRQSHVSDMAIYEIGGQVFLIAGYEGNTRLVSYEIGSNGSATFRGGLTLPGGPSVGDLGSIAVGAMGDLVVTGLYGQHPQVVDVRANGSLALEGISSFGRDLGRAPGDFELVDLPGGTFAYSISGTGNLIEVDSFRSNGSGVVESVVTVTGANGGYMAIRDVTIAEVGSATYLVAAVSGADTIISYSVADDGRLTEIGRIGAANGLGIHLPEVITSVHLGTQTYVLVGSAGSGTLTVLRVPANGRLQAVDHVVDDLGTRFDGIVAIETLMVNGTQLVFVAGSDDGLSVLQLLPNGRLIHRATIEDTLESTLQNINDIEVIQNGNRIQIFVTGTVEDGISLLEIDIAEIGLTRITGTAGQSLSGGTNDDVLFARHMNVQLTGGAGADRFVFDAGYGASGSLGTIMDFQPGVDRILFPSLPHLSNLSQFDIVSTANGAILTYGEVSVTIRSATGQPLTADDFTQADFFEFDSHFIGNAPDSPVFDYRPPAPDAPRHLLGTPFADRLEGAGGNDTLMGYDGNDVLIGADGHDRIEGGDGADRLVGGTGNDTIHGGATSADLRDEIFGGAGNDLIDGGYGNDEIYGQEGNDTIIGGFGSDVLAGQQGDDVITGGPLSDLIFGNDGNDFINGGFGFDRINGGAGADRFYHLGIADHGSDWIQDFSDDEGDVLVFANGRARPEDFQVNFAVTENAGVADVAEAFVIYRPTGQIIWALVDGGDLDSLMIQFGSDATQYDLLA
ncbi:hypothetical protein [Jannaschia pohangensis]|uniref:Hemolysin-type calcium-binding repeat-containing protein n=1 Tax=Jannaschia pohangensis TaxID=390807 RepID=A0A1I3RFC5_9RHOB|nr:hypothetical protein [Jannaschia pohangensis]SFJ43997.1 Hemolysin-type calcium-binding repeat-containing protein [Jannaschia pohangensis]